MKNILALALTLMFAISAVASEWEIDKAHSSVGFTIRHMVISKTTGKFTDFSGSFTFGENLADGKVSMTVQMASIDTDNEERDEHLRSADFLDVEEHPSMSFTSTKIVIGEDNHFQLVGDLALNGVTREVDFICEMLGQITDPWGNARIGFTAKTTIDRHDFGVSWSKTLDSGGLIVGNEVSLIIQIEAIQEKDEEKEEEKENE